MTDTVQKATIIGTILGVKHTDHGILSFYINLNYGGSMQGFGGVVLDTVNPAYTAGDRTAPVRIPTPLASGLLLGVDQVFHCDWEELKGTPCRAYSNFSGIKAIGHFLDDKWLSLQADGDDGDYAFVVTTLKELQQRSGT